MLENTINQDFNGSIQLITIMAIHFDKNKCFS